MKNNRFLLYGAYGYTGRLIVQEALRVGLRPVLAGRDPERLQRLSNQTGLEYRVFTLEHPAELDAGLADMPLVLHAAGPFRDTARPMVSACLRGRRHYLDVTGEINVIEAIAARDSRARDLGIVLLPAVGFDVVPSDCLALHVARKVPSATRLEIAFLSGGAPSRGTTRTALRNLGLGGVVRRGGRLERVAHGRLKRQIDFGKGEVEVVSIPWGDIATAYRSTGIPDITAYTSFPKSQVRLLQLVRFAAPLLGTKPGRVVLEAALRRIPEGPSDAARRSSESRFWAEVQDEEGHRVAARLRTPEGYTLTAMTAVECARRVLAGEVSPGFHTPGTAFGPDFILQFEGCVRGDVGD